MSEDNATPSEYTPSADATDITADKDGGVLKEIKVAGTGDRFPARGDTVFVHYVGRLTDGSVFDSSRDRDEQFEFCLGKGSVIKAWDCGVATMKRGEVAIFTCRSDYAYGAKGSPPKIPADATLVFEVELFDWKAEDVTKSKDGGVMRNILTEGIGYMSPNEGATCEVRLVGSYNGTVFETRELTFVMGEASEVDLIDGIEVALKKFKQGERSRLQITSKYAYGAGGCEKFKIPASADLEYEVTLTKFEKCKEAWEMDNPEKLEQAELKKDRGSVFFKQGKLTLARRYYAAAASCLDGEDAMEGTEGTRRTTVLLAAYLNLAAVALKTDDPAAVCTHCDAALALQAGCVKALFRRGTARLSLNDYESSVADFRAVIAVEPDNKAAKNKLVGAEQKMREQLVREKSTYMKMFQQMAKTEAADAAKTNGEAKKLVAPVDPVVTETKDPEAMQV